MPIETPLGILAKANAHGKYEEQKYTIAPKRHHAEQGHKHQCHRAPSRARRPWHQTAAKAENQ